MLNIITLQPVVNIGNVYWVKTNRLPTWRFSYKPTYTPTYICIYIVTIHTYIYIYIVKILLATKWSNTKIYRKTIVDSLKRVFKVYGRITYISVEKKVNFLNIHLKSIYVNIIKNVINKVTSVVEILLNIHPCVHICKYIHTYEHKLCIYIHMYGYKYF